MSVEVMPLGDRAVLINFKQTIDPETHGQVMALKNKIETASIEGITFVLGAYCSITVGYAQEKISYGELKKLIKSLWIQPANTHKLSDRVLYLPVCYDQPYALDLLEISKFSGLKPEEIVAKHGSQSYLVYMLGFLPGFPYLGILPEILHFPRKKSPRLRIPERSVGIAGAQTGIYPSESPGGWNIIGSTPLPIFNASRKDPFLFRPGDKVHFQAISKKEYELIRQEVKQGAYNWDSING